MQRPTVPVYNQKDQTQITSEIRLPNVFLTPLRQDIVQFVHDNLSRNTRQAHGVDNRAGLKHSAESWGTGRAVARIPRIKGSGTHRSGQGAYGNMCRKGHMAFPLHSWRRWHRKVNLRQRRHALASALAATSVTPLVLARGHRVMQVPQLPLVLDDSVSSISKTKEVVALLRRFGAYDDVERVVNAKSLRPGRGKVRNMKFKKRRGPLFVVDDNSTSLVRALRNIPGVDAVNVNRLNIRMLAPGGQLGRFCVFTATAMNTLESQFGSYKGSALAKKGYMLKREVISNPDISSIINSDEIQSVLNKKKTMTRLHTRQKKNPMKNKSVMDTLNPYAPTMRAMRNKKIAKRDGKAHRERAMTLLKNLETKVDEKIAEDNQVYMKNVELTKY